MVLTSSKYCRDTNASVHTVRFFFYILAQWSEFWPNLAKKKLNAILPEYDTVRIGYDTVYLTCSRKRMIRFTFSADYNVPIRGGYACCALHCRFLVCPAFLPRNAIHKRGLCHRAMSVRLFVCPSVTFVYSVERNKDIFNFFTVE